MATRATVDSTLTREEALHRFRIGLDSISDLANGTTDQTDLVKRFVSAIGARDTAALGELALTKQEFAWIYYPTTPQGLPPYDLAPSLLWFLVEGRGAQGLARALRTLGGQPIIYSSHSCDTEPSIEGNNRIWGPCQVTIRTNGTTSTLPLIGQIIERNGRFKFLNYTNKLD